MAQATQIFAGEVFVTNPFIVNAFIRQDVLEERFVKLVDRIQKDASTGCGQHFELFEARVLSSLSKQLASFKLPHNEMFNLALRKRGWRLKELPQARQAAHDCLAEINQEMV